MHEHLVACLDNMYMYKYLDRFLYAMYIHTHIDAYIHAYIDARMHTYIHTCMHRYTHTDIHRYTYTLYTHTHTHTYACIYTKHLCTHVCLYVCMYVVTAETIFMYVRGGSYEFTPFTSEAPAP